VRNLTVLLVLLIVAAISYGLGRKHGGHHRITSAANTETAPSAKARVIRTTKAPHENPQSALHRGAPFAQNLTSAERGYEAASINLDEALKQIASLPVSERMGFTTGIFSFVA